jgi:hypothetical protein
VQCLVLADSDRHGMLQLIQQTSPN